MKKQLLILMTLFTVIIGYSQTFTALDNNNNTLEYTVIPSTTNVKVDAYVSGGTDIDIPLTVTYSGATYNVTTIDYSAFSGKGITSVIIPNSIITINGGAFVSNALTSVTIPDSVTSIGLFAFKSNPLTCVISEAITPPTITTTGTNDSFGNRSNINLSIPTGTASAYAAAQWTGFNSVAEGLTGTFVVDHITYQINANPNNEVTITDYNTAGGTVVTIPATVNSGCTAFSVTDIGVGAFLGNSLTSVTFTIPSSVTSIAQNGFKNNQLSILNIPNSVVSIGNSAFNNNNLSNITIPNSVVSIGNSAFSVNQLISVSIPNSVTSLGNYTFWNNLLETVTIPSSIVSIGTYVFADNNLTDVYSLGTTPPTITTGGSADTFGVAERGTIHLHIPSGAGVLDAYTNASTGALWTGFNPVTQDAGLNVSDFELVNDIRVITTTDEIRVTHSNNIRLQNYTIYSITGAIIAKGNKSEIPTTYITSGIYILKLDFDKGIVTKKVVVN